MISAPVFKLKPTVQTYDWGKIGGESKVAQLAQAGKAADFTMDDSKPYAELWMGTHSTSPSFVHGSELSLKDHLAANADLIGPKVTESFKAHEGDVPFLFKVLSIHKALSIQTHPDKVTAEKLHAEQPNIYKDDNHKPEMAIALTPFTALCGFRPLSEIANYLVATPEFATLIPHTIAAKFIALASTDTPEGPEEKAALRDLFAAVMTAHPFAVQTQLAALVERYKSAGGGPEEEKDIVALVLTLNEQFPDDIGIFCAYLLNYITLQPGEAIFLSAGEPHAYVSGDIMECMATSDNVIRAGLTPKLRDVPNLVSGLTYIAGHHSKHVVKPTQFSERSRLYNPPIPEFAVVELRLQPNERDVHRALEGPSIVSVTAGSGTIQWSEETLPVVAGDVLFMGAGIEISFGSEGEGLTLYRAFVEI